MAVGLLMSQRPLTVVLADEAARIAVAPLTGIHDAEHIPTHFETLLSMGALVTVEEESLRRLGFLPEQVLTGISVEKRVEITKLLSNAHMLISY